jgi:hypothetical protein
MTFAARIERQSTVNHLHRFLGLLTAGAFALLALTFTAPAALASLPPPDPNPAWILGPPAIHTVVTGGMPGWQIALIAVAAALLAAAAAVFLDRAWAQRAGQRSTA